MRLFALSLIALLVAAACGGAAQPSPTAAATTAAPTVAATTAAPTAAAQVKFTADLKPESEVPPVANDEKVGSGKATVTFDLRRDAAGKVTSGKATFDISVTGLPAGAAVTLAHIHRGPAGVAGNPVVNIKTDAANPIAVTTGPASITKADVDVDGAVMQEILDNPAGFYVNVHSRLNPGGVVRGQLVKAS